MLSPCLFLFQLSFALSPLLSYRMSVDRACDATDREAEKERRGMACSDREQEDVQRSLVNLSACVSPSLRERVASRGIRKGGNSLTVKCREKKNSKILNVGRRHTHRSTGLGSEGGSLPP